MRRIAMLSSIAVSTVAGLSVTGSIVLAMPLLLPRRGLSDLGAVLAVIELGGAAAGGFIAALLVWRGCAPWRGVEPNAQVPIRRFDHEILNALAVAAIGGLSYVAFVVAVVALLAWVEMADAGGPPALGVELAILPLLVTPPAIGAGLGALAARGCRYTRATSINPGVCTACGYDLRGTLAAEREVCPECGAAVSREQTLAWACDGRDASQTAA